MNTVFIGGSRHISRLPIEAKGRLKKMLDSRLLILVGDAKGADTAVQEYLRENSYENVIVYCSGTRCRNNVGNWQARNINVSTEETGYHYYAAKDREMARDAEFGYMIWDGKSPGTMLNILRLVNGGKKAVLLDASTKQTVNFKTRADWNVFITKCSETLLKNLEKRASNEEWVNEGLPNQESLFDATPQESSYIADPRATLKAVDAALAAADGESVIEALDAYSRAEGVDEPAKGRLVGLGRNPEFDAVLRVVKAMGLRFSIHARDGRSPRARRTAVAPRLRK
jgi:DNA-binding phage protein